MFSPAVLEQLEADGVSLRPYESVYSYVGRLTPSQRVMLDTRRINTTLLTSIPSHVSVMDRPNPTALRKAIKNPVEIANMKQAHLADGIALTRFMYWLKTQVGSQPITERSAAAQLEAFRRACPLYLQPSFDPILAAGPHSAIVHYSATPESDRAVTGQGFLLADTGGHYYTGTTDCTRTYALGPLSEQKKPITPQFSGEIWPWQTQPSRPAARAATWTTRPGSPCGNWVWTLTTAPATGWATCSASMRAPRASANSPWDGKRLWPPA